MRLVIGIDIAKDTHWLTAVTERGEVVLDRAVPNEPAALEEVVAALRDRGAERVFGIDVLGGIATLALAVLLANEEQVVYVPGLAVNRARDAEVGGETKSDSRDARVIAEQVRTRRDLRPLRPDDETVAALRVLVTRRRDLVTEQTRRLARLHELLVRVHPGLERRLELTTKGALVLLRRYVTPAELRRGGAARVARHLRAAGIPRAERVAARALESAQEQRIVLPAEAVTAALVKELAAEALAARERLAALEAQLGELVARHPEGTLIRSLPGMGVVLTSELLATAGDQRRFRSADALAAAAGLAPVLRQSGRTRVVRRAHRGSRVLKWIFWQAAHCAVLNDPVSRQFYQRKRAEGKGHQQAILALARRRINVLWAMLRDHKPYDTRVPRAVAA